MRNGEWGDGSGRTDEQFVWCGYCQRSVWLKSLHVELQRSERRQRCKLLFGRNDDGERGLRQRERPGFRIRAGNGFVLDGNAECPERQRPMELDVRWHRSAQWYGCKLFCEFGIERGWRVRQCAWRNI